MNDIIIHQSRSCYFDGVTGVMANILFTTVPLTVILVMNIVLYTLTWFRVRSEEQRFRDMSGKDARIIRASHRFVKSFGGRRASHIIVEMLDFPSLY